MRVIALPVRITDIWTDICVIWTNLPAHCASHSKYGYTRFFRFIDPGQLSRTISFSFVPEIKEFNVNFPCDKTLVN